VVLATVMAVGCAGPVDPAAKDAFFSSLGDTTMTVFPAFVRDGHEGLYDEAAAVRIGELFTDEGLAEATISQERVPITGPWHCNQARMLSESAAEFAGYLQDHPVDTEYAFLPEYLLLRDSAVGGIHCYIVDAENRLAYVVLQNSHWPIFTEVDPQTLDDCTEILIRVLRQELSPAEGGE
jgi:hypothetical protein